MSTACSDAAVNHVDYLQADSSEYCGVSCHGQVSLGECDDFTTITKEEVLALELIMKKRPLACVVITVYTDLSYRREATHSVCTSQASYANQVAITPTQRSEYPRCLFARAQHTRRLHLPSMFHNLTNKLTILDIAPDLLRQRVLSVVVFGRQVDVDTTALACEDLGC